MADELIMLGRVESRARALEALRDFRVPCQDRRPATTYGWDGRSLATRGMRAESLFHELAHWFLAAPERRKIPEYGLGPGPEGGPRRRGLPPAPAIWRGAVCEWEEFRASVLGILLQASYGLEYVASLVDHGWGKIDESGIFMVDDRPKFVVILKSIRNRREIVVPAELDGLIEHFMGIKQRKIEYWKRSVLLNT